MDSRSLDWFAPGTQIDLGLMPCTFVTIEGNMGTGKVRRAT